MNCLNCGAPLATVSRFGVGQCIYCDSRRVLPGGSEGLEGVVLLGGPTDLDCPACNDQLVSAIIDNVPCRACPSCFGVSIPQGAFGQLVADRRAGYQGADRASAPLNPLDLQQQRDCPLCRETMEVHPYYGPGRTVIDSCSDCRLVWLDAGELTAIEQAPGRRGFMV